MRHQDFSLLANAAEEVANVLEQLATQHPDVFKSLGIRHPLADELGGYAFMLRDHVLTGEAPSAPSEPIAVQQADPAPGQPRVLITVSGGYADWVCDDGVDVEVFDFDEYAKKCANDPTRKLPAHFSDLALSVGAAFKGDGHSEKEDLDLSDSPVPGGWWLMAGGA